MSNPFGRETVGTAGAKRPARREMGTVGPKRLSPLGDDASLKDLAAFYLTYARDLIDERK